MNPRMFLSMALATMSLIFASGCSTDAKKKSAETQTATSSSEATDVPHKISGSYYTSLEFEKGETTLSEEAIQELNELAQKVNQDGREIEEIKVLAWADKEYPLSPGKRISSSELKLAKKRAEAVKSYIKKDLHSSVDVDAFNMARKPDKLSRILQTEDFQVKKTYEQSGATSTVNEQGEVSWSKASKALVIVEYKDDEKQRIK